MKIPGLIFILMIIVACSQNRSTQTEEAAEEVMEEAAPPEEAVADEETVFIPRSEIHYTIDTLAETYVVKELKKSVGFQQGNGIIKEYSFNNPEGIERPFSVYDDSPLFESFQKAQNKVANYSDTSFWEVESEYTKYYYQVNKEGNLVKYKDYLFDITINSFQEGRWSEAILGQKDERSGHVTYTFIERDFKNINKRPPSYYLTVNGENPSKKSKKNIIDYYVLAIKTGTFGPDQMGGNFDVKNGYFDYSSEGTGAGTYTEQLVLFRANDGSEILGINSYGTEYISFAVTQGSKPSFFTFQNSQFSPIEDIFPDLNSSLFFDGDYSDDIPTYFKLPQYGLSATYNVSEGAFDYCENLDKENAEDWAIDICTTYENIVRRSIEIPFNKATGKFEVD